MYELAQLHNKVNIVLIYLISFFISIYFSPLPGYIFLDFFRHRRNSERQHYQLE